MRNRWWATSLGAAGAAALIAGCGSSGTPPASHTTTGTSATPQAGSHAPTVTIMTHSTSNGTVLTNDQGRTLYWFALDTSSSSMCTGSCATYWPPVIGTPTLAAGTSLPHGFGTITRSNGQVQATYDGHPLYTYMGDTAAGQASGNGKNLSGGKWWAMTPSGAQLGSSTPSGSSSSSGGGYGY